MTAEVTTADGTAVLTYAIGTDGYYMRVSGDDSVYTVDGQTVAALCQTAEQLKYAFPAQHPCPLRRPRAGSPFGRAFFVAARDGWMQVKVSANISRAIDILTKIV